MLPKRQRHIFYAALLLTLSAVCTTAVANSSVIALLSEVISPSKIEATDTLENNSLKAPTTTANELLKSSATASAPFFMTIIQGADEEVNCADNGLTIARFNLCGDFDDRVISLSGSYSNVSWYQLGGACSPDVNDDCPNTTVSCYGSPVSTGPTFSLDASAISSSNGAEFRVVADGQQFFFKVKKSNITQSVVTEDYICGVPGRIQVTNLSSAYEFSIDSGSGFGPWQGPIFNNLLDGTYIVKARLQNTPDACEYPYEPIVINAIDLAIEVDFVDADCVGETGSITVTPTAGIGPYKYTLLDDTGSAQEFTPFIPDNPYTFSAVGFGTYTVQVETQECTGDVLNGIDPPRQSLDTGGNPITIGAGVAALTASAEPNNSFSTACGINTVDITVYTSGGTAPYTYIVNGVGPSSPSYTDSRVETITTPGTYEFLITDANGCTITASANVEELTPPDITVAGVDGTCTNGGSRLEFTIVDAKGFDLEYRADPGNAWSNNPVLSVPPNVTYNNIQVQYSSGAFTCIMDLPDSITVNGVNGITGTAVKNSDVSCNLGGGTTGGEIEFQGPFTGGSGTGYQYSIDGVTFSTNLTYSGLAQGTYTPVIIDDSGCRRDLTAIQIFDVDPPTDIAFAQNDINCAAGTSEVILTVTGSAAIATYEIINPTAFNNGGNNTFVGLNTGTTYEFRATDVNGCSIVENFTPIVTSSIRARVQAGGDLRVCTGASDGTGTFLIDGFANNYTYNINGGPESAPQNDAQVVLPPSGAGTYTITITDADTGCTDTASFDIIEPASPINLTGTVRDMSCANNNRGRVIADATGGWNGYLYTLTYPAASGVPPVTKTGRTFNNLTHEGNYELSVVDSEGCTDTFNFSLTAIDAPAIALDDAASDFCYVPGTGATIGVTSTAGSALVATHQYRINGGSLQASPVFTGLTPGNYTIEVVDGNNCSAPLNVTVRPQLRVNTSIDTEIPCGGAPGQIRVQVSGGYLGSPDSPSTPKIYQVSIDGGAFGPTTPFSANSFLYSVTAGGTYVFRVTDNENCVADSSPLVVDPPQLIAPATAEVNPVSCGGTDNGRVIITPDATSGIPPYEVNFNGMGWTTQTVYSNLPVGTYPYLVRDSRGCETPPADAVVALDTTLPPDATASPLPATCSAGNIVEGGIQVTSVANGTPNFTFIVRDNLGTQLVEVNDVDPGTDLPLNINDPSLVPGTYTLVTLDANGCRDEDTITITTNEVVITPIDFEPAITCDDSAFTYTVQVTPTIFPTVPTYEIRIAGQPTFYALNNSNGPDTHTFSNTADGIQYGVAYTVEVLAPNGCIYEQEIPPIDGFSALDVTASSTAGYCDAFRNGQIQYSVDGFNSGDDLLIELRNNDDGSTITIENLTNVTTIPYTNTYEAVAGDYQILVTNLTDTCTDAVGIIIDQNLPSIDILAEEPANCNAEGQITVQGSGGSGGPYEFFFATQGDPEPSAIDPGWTTNTTFIGPAATYDVYVRDNSGVCTSSAIATIIQLDPDLVPPTIDVVNQCVVTATAFDITVSMPGGTDTPRFTLAGDTQFGVFNGGTNLWEYTYQVSSPGSYIVDVIDANGCTSQGTAEVYEFLSASGDFSTIPTCNTADGIITMNVIGGSDQFSYQLQDGGGADIGAPVTGDRNAGILTGVAPGTYQVEVTDTETGCDFTVDVQLAAATPPIIDGEFKQDISCEGENDGTIDIILQPGSDIDTPIQFILNNLDSGLEHTRNNTGSFIDLPPAEYQVEVLTARNCSVLSNPIDIIEPTPFTISTMAPANFICEPNANQFSVATIIVNGSGGTPGLIAGQEYQYSIVGFSNYQYSNTFEVVDNGSIQNITIYAIDDNGCQASTVVTINPPSTVVPSLSVISPLDCRDDEVVEISATGTNDFTVITTGPSGTTIANVNGTNTTPATILLPVAGDYNFIVRDNSPFGCDYPMPQHTVNIPQDPTAVASEGNPVQCFGDANGSIFIEVSDYSGIYDYRVFEGSDTTKTTVITSGTFDTANFPDVSGDPARITGLAAGNYYVEVVSQAAPYCRADSNVMTVRSPNGVLDVQAVETGNVSCDDNIGKIVATGSGGWDIAAYEFQLRKDDELGTSPFPIEVPYQASNEFENLTHGNYIVEIRDAEGCTDSFALTLDEIPPIVAGIREPVNLVCPGGNNAVLEAFDIATGNPGASGGVAGAGYKYQLIYLDSPNTVPITPSTPVGLDERNRSGLQDGPTFIGTSGGVISAGWYAIEVTSSFSCSFVTPPYEVIPPPPIEPRLVQTRVPGCGGDGEMRLFIENPDPLFTYEYLMYENGAPVGTYTAMVGSEVFPIPGFDGITYQFDVRKINASNTCDAVQSNGITIRDATGILLTVTQIDDISCDDQQDGRIESFASGGIGNEIFTIYHGNPIDAYSPDPGAVEVASQDFGTFEGLLPADDYYIAVRSGVSGCEDIQGPFVIVNPEPIVVARTPTPVSCNGEEDGTILVEVTSGGEGLIQFAIGPNFDEFFSDSANPGTYVFDELAAGTYEILIQDDAGCVQRRFVEVTEPDELQITGLQTTPELCIDASDGTVIFNIQGGTPFNDPMVSATPYYEYKLEMNSPIDETGTGVFAPYDGQAIQNLQGGATYVLYIQDANLCPAADVFDVGVGVDLAADPLVQYGCEGMFPNSTASVLMQDSSVLPELLYYLEDMNAVGPPLTIQEMIDQADTQSTWGDLPSSEYTAHIFHSNGCSNSVQFEIEQYDPLILTAEKTDVNEVTATASGGYGEYEFFFQGVSQGADNVYLTNMDTTVEVRVVDAQGCEATVAIPFEFTGMLEIPNFFTPDGDGMNDEWVIQNRELFPNIEVKIYDRYGRVVAELDQLTNWDGTYESKDLPSGDYWYVVNQNDARNTRFVGHFTLYR
ncbi:T9SS type B sorting domain-containing protein [Aggregatimonas sangjinii]|uniref:T9SS type B sorting domain-containing protein n=1 Tax=Aggregatimonas sangjinii TaxID=2583587 RepID=A0A5B7SRK2_9FLAO|nr:T9SS type B sorting domain-containing protein [Aggregatimonas sangjinii]QCW99627.1 T9SS type B sorting domain-containing protein [Aggregatimonas sangjinii]